MSQNPVASIEVDSGTIIIAELYPDIAPNTVSNFISLANSGFYDGLIFHRVIPLFMIQGGSPRGSGSGGPGYCIPGEFEANGFPNSLNHARGVLSMARSQNMDSAGSQFFIVVADSPHLDGLYATFGKVIEGMTEVDLISKAKTNKLDVPKNKQYIKQIRVETFGVKYPLPEKSDYKPF